MTAPSRSVLFKTVEAFASLTNRRLWLKSDKHISTDGNQISVPLDNPYAFRFVEKMLGHILFQTNLLALQTFAESYAQQIREACEDQGVDLTDGQAKSLRDLLLLLCKVFETHRVSTLWGLIYEGSAEVLQQLVRSVAQMHASHAHSNFVIYATLRQAGVQPEPGPFSKFDHVVTTALEKVACRGPAATMAVTKWTVIQVISALLHDDASAPPPPPGGPPPGGQGPSAPQASSNSQRAEALKDFIQQGCQLPDNLFKLLDHVKLSDKGAQKLAQMQAQKIVNDVLSVPVVDPGKLDQFLATTTEQMMQAVDKAKQLATKGVSADEEITRDAGAKVILHDVTVEQVTSYLQKKTKGDPSAVVAPPLEGDDLVTARKLRVLFEQLHARKRRELAFTGTVIDSMAVIQSVLSKSARPIFKTTVSGRGFDLLVLMDRSSSMGGPKKTQVERACRILAEALDFPFVRFHAWGFQALEPGQVDIYRFDTKLRVFDTESAQVGGRTPLHVATQVATRFLMRSNAVKNMVSLTDCIPTFDRRDLKSVDREHLVELTRREVQFARRHGVNVTGAIVPNIKLQKDGEWLPDFSTKKHVRAVFGSAQFWSYLDPYNLGDELVRLVARSFVQYLRA